jgi:chemotaxis protein methyltransferase CheR
MKHQKKEGSSNREREFIFTTEHFVRVRDELYDYAGIVLADHKQDMVYNRLVRRLRDLNLVSFDDYLIFLNSDSAEFTKFINAMTTNLTSFFREKHHFEFINKTIIPDMSKQGNRRLRVWSAGCSLGEEPYSIAMTLLDSNIDVSNWDIRLLATDIDSAVLARAARGVYGFERIESLPKMTQRKWFLKGVGKNQGQMKIQKALQAMITFNHLNLMHDWPMQGPFDFIFCRNVMIYFDTKTQEKLLDRMADLIKPGGYLFVGHSEALARHGNRFKLMGKTIYQKV